MRLPALVLLLAVSLASAQNTVTLYYTTDQPQTMTWALSNNIYSNAAAPRNPTIYPATGPGGDIYQDLRLPLERIHWQNVTHLVYFGNVNVSTSQSPYFMLSWPNSTQREYEEGYGRGGVQWQRRLIDEAHAHNVKILLVINAVIQAPLSYVAGDSLRTQVFVDSLTAYLKRWGFDGIDLNWENTGGAITATQPQIARLFRRIRLGLDSMTPHGCFSLSPGPNDMAIYPVSVVNATVDMIHPQEYAFTPAWWATPGPNRGVSWWKSAVYGGKNYPAGFQGRYVDNMGPKQWVAAGYSKSLLGLLLPALGTLIAGTDSLYGSYTATYDNAFYADRAWFLSHGATLQSDDSAHANAPRGRATATRSGVLSQRNFVSGTKYFLSMPDSASTISGVRWGLENGFTHFALFSMANDAGLVLHDVFLNAFAGNLNSGGTTGVIGGGSSDGDAALPTRTELRSNYPNPFNPETTIEFQLAQPGEISLNVYNLLGQEVASLASGHMSAGRHAVRWNAGRMASGVYYARLQSEGHARTIPMILAR